MNNTINKETFVEQIFNKYSDEIYNFVLNRIGYNKTDAEDLTQEVFLRVWKSRESYDSARSSIRTWIYIIARNLLKDRFKKKKLDFSLIEDDSVKSDDPIEGEVQYAEIIKALEKLSPSDRELLQLRFVQDLGVGEMIQILNKSESAIKTGIHRALKKLKKIINERN